MKVIFALTNQPGFDKAAFASSLKTEAAGMPDEYDVARTFLLETAERLAPPA
ncbi:MAG TPA: hypothetical protein VMA55_01170 [Acidovorax sp.]|nr:hypothetical protein [Acidovorax sp.]